MHSLESLLQDREKTFRKLWLVSTLVINSLVPVLLLVAMLSYLVNLWAILSLTQILTGASLFCVVCLLNFAFFWILKRCAYNKFGTKYLLTLVIFASFSFLSLLTELFRHLSSPKEILTSLCVSLITLSIGLLHLKMFLINKSLKKRARALASG